VFILGCEVVCRNIHLSWFWHDHFHFAFSHRAVENQAPRAGCGKMQQNEEKASFRELKWLRKKSLARRKHSMPALKLRDLVGAHSRLCHGSSHTDSEAR